MQKRHPREGGAVLLAGNERALSTENHPALQPANACQLQALRLIARHHVRPAMAMTLASLCYGEAR